MREKKPRISFAAHPVPIPPKAILPALFALAVLFASCDPADGKNRLSRGSGTMLLRHGAYLYRIGGLEGGKAGVKAQMAKVSPEGSIGPWTNQTPLPKGRAFGCAVAVGNFIYVIGGRGPLFGAAEEGPLDTVLYTLIDPEDGTLGSSWETCPQRLPEPRERASAVAWDGRFYLIGGDSGKNLSSSILHCRMSPNDLMPGYWYRSPASLPSARRSAAISVCQKDGADYLVVAGGSDEAGALDDARLYEIARDGSGRLSDAGPIARLPKPLYSAVLAEDGDSLVLAGGYADKEGAKDVYRYSHAVGKWTKTPGFSVPAEGGYAGRSGGSLLYLPQPGILVPAAGAAQGVFSRPDPPSVFPGSGLVVSSASGGQRTKIQAGPDSTVRYDSLGGDVSAADPICDPAASPRVGTAPSTPKYAFRSFPGAAVPDPSIQIHRAYMPISGGWEMMGKISLEPMESGAGPVECIFQPGRAQAFIELTVRAQDCVGGPATLRLELRDAADDPAEYGARVGDLSVFEGWSSGDYYTPVPDSDGEHVYKSFCHEIRLRLFPGKYHIFLTLASEGANRTFAVAAWKETP